MEIKLNRYKMLDKIKSNFILQIAHELRSPIADLIGYNEIIMRGITGKINKKTEEVIFKANHRTKNLLTIIDEMLDYAYMESEEEIKYGMTWIQFKTIIDYNHVLFLDKAMQKDINLVSNCSNDLMILANSDLLNIIFFNLLSNSIKYSPKKTTITVNASVDNEKIHIFVKDEGMGIELKEFDNIFEEFYRTRRAREIEREGTGMGLPIVKKAVEKLNGGINLYSEVSKGTTFHIYLSQYFPENIYPE